MAISYTLVPQPLYIFNDLSGLPLGGGYMRTTRFLNPTQYKPVFQDPGGLFPWPTQLIPNQGLIGGVAFSMNGTQGPFFWEFDDALPSEYYFVEIFDSDGNLVFDTQGTPFGPGVAGGGGGGTVTTAFNLENYIINGQFWRHFGSDNISFIPGTLTTLAPSAHTGLVANGLASTNTIVNGAPDMCFIKTNLTATDTLTFGLMTFGIFPFSPDVTPIYFLNYTCSVVGTDTNKAFQIPITNHVMNLSGQDVSIKIWAQGLSPVTQLSLQWVQFFGDGPSASPPLITPIGTCLPNSTWQAFPFTTTIPNVVGNTPGECGNDGLFLQIQFPLGDPCNINIAKPALYLGHIPLNTFDDFNTNDQIEAIVDDFRTGDIRYSLNSFVPFGWVMMNDGTIGSQTSGATSRANIDTFPLFNLIWNLFQSTPALAPIFTSAGAPLPVYGASAIADFAANRRLSLTKAAGRVFANIGMPSVNSVPVTGGTNTLINWAIGQTTGNERHQQSVAEMANHNHPGSTITIGSVIVDGTVNTVTVYSPLGAVATPGLINITPEGGGNAMNIQVPVSYTHVFIKL